MNYFLLIHTSLDKAFVALSSDGIIRSVKRSDNPREHGAFVHEAIHLLLEENQMQLSELHAIGVTNGPGSYTGIRVGLSAAKGLGYALNIPLVLCNNLLALAATAVDRIRDKDAVYVPLIHARQAEYYTGAYDYGLNRVREESLIETDKDFSNMQTGKKYIFFGLGLDSFKQLTGAETYQDIEQVDETSMAKVISAKFSTGQVTSALNAVPLYLKEAFVRKSN